jgi:teichuronic acid biosynthesis glycosyltransferase TuaC
VRILFVTNMYPTSERPGYGAFVWQQAEQLRQFGHLVDIINIEGFKSKLNYFKAAIQVVRRTSLKKYDVVHAHYGLSAFPAWFRFKAPLVITFHGSDVLVKGLFQSFSSRVASHLGDSVIIVSEEMRKKISGFLIPCGVDLRLFRPHDRAEARVRLGWSKDKYIVLFPFEPTRRVKRFDLAKAAVDRLVKEGLDVELVTVFRVENREMPWYYSGADAMILTSDSEGSPTSVKEALACNLPVIATDVGDISEIMSGVRGARICSQEVNDIARGLREVLELKDSSDGCERRMAMTRYDQTVTVQKIVDVYADVIRKLKKNGEREQTGHEAKRSSRKTAV